MRQGHTIVTTGTASGKSLCFNLPVAPHALLRHTRAGALPLSDQGARAGPGARARGAPVPALRHAIYDGDTPQRERAAIRKRVEPRADEPRHAARRDPSPPRPLGGLPRQPRARGRRRGPRLSRASSAPTSRTCCGACAGSPPPTARRRASCSPRPRSPIRVQLARARSPGSTSTWSTATARPAASVRS